MAMFVQHNLRAMNSNRMLGVNTSTLSKSTEKLSSGYKINRAADDAAGLSISEKMRKQIRGLTQASANAQDGISAVQTAEGALNEVQDMLQRMNELAVKAANGTMSENDRDYIQNEIDQLTTEIDRVAETTKFNETYLLKGGDEKRSIGVKTTAYDAETPAVTAANYVFNDGKMVTNLDSVFSIDADTAEIGIREGMDLTAGKAATIGDFATSVADSDVITWANADEKLYAVKDADGSVTEVTKDNYNQFLSTDDTTAVEGKDGYTFVTASDTAIAEDTVDTYAEAVTADAVQLSLHVGADSGSENQINVKIAAMDTETLGVKDLSVASKDSATNAIDTISAAIQRVSTQRSALGAIQNRLEHTISNLDNVVENTTAAESQIRDTDMATEMVKYSNTNILAQAGQAMLAQSNQANQGVLSLLQ